ncbi:MAG TPA: DASS family sodium-coupled anion symporter [Thermoanaerobaculia bacterium]|nr:DASS family sodium-coupled anion symporter [Thermoanaerobaculia bacterium]HUM30220.1 DASS family sodium-coupled anion symporter [Thermoanaerobaculia bacterium]HXK68484.1 DASS family sodium-coupled anion symporter [Thermoanaerobaculia bacterium]
MTRRVVGLVLGPVLFFTVLLSPIFPTLTSEPRKTLACALLIATWWITEPIPIAVTSLLPLFLFPVFGIMPSARVAPNYTNHLVFLFLGGFVLAAGIEAVGLHRRIALVTLRFIGGSLPRIVLGFMLATAFLSMWVSNTATVLMMLPIAMAVLKLTGDHLDGSAQKSLGTVLMLGIAYSASIGGIGTLIGTPPNIVFSGLAQKLLPNHPEITFTGWLAIGLPAVFLLLPIVWLYLTRFGGATSLFSQKLPNEIRTALNRRYADLGPMDSREKAVLIVFLFTAFLWITRSPIQMGSLTIPGWSSLFPWKSFLHDSTVAIGAAVVLFLIHIGGKPILQWQETEDRIPWGVLLLFGGGFALAEAFQQSGLASWFGDCLSGLGALPTLPLVFAVVLIMDLLTEVTSNTAITATMLPIVATTAMAIGKDPLLLMIGATLGASCAFALPVATPPNAIVFASGEVSIQQMAKTGIFVDLIAAVTLTAVVLVMA